MELQRSADSGGTEGNYEVPVIRVVEGLLAKPWEVEEEELPTNVSKPQQLDKLPQECLSGDSSRPLQHCDDKGTISRYALNPMTYSVVFILSVELLERFSFYGVNYTQTSYLTGAYDKDWNAGMSSVEASSYVSVSVAIAYTAPFFGAILADSMLGDYASILIGSLCFYLPGLLMMALTTMPGLLGEEFNESALKLGLLFLWPIGTGIVKSILNVFGAKQYHPLLQSSLIESYYVNFYMCINIGAPVGGILIPVLAQHNVTLAYFVPVGMLALGITLFVAGTPRYVRSKPQHQIWQRRQQQQAPITKSSFRFMTIFSICFLIIPFAVVYSQMATTFIVQGTVMRKAFGWIDAASMNNFDAASVLVFGNIIGNYIFPELAKRNIKIATTHKFAIGSAFGAMAIACALFVEHKIHSTYHSSQTRISVLWQVFSYMMVGIGEIFAVSTAYEAAFMAAPPQHKAQASAVNLFCIGGIPNILCIALYHIGARWFTNSKGNRNISDIEDYVEARVSNYFWVLFFICVFGVIVNLLPQVKNYVAAIEEEAAATLKTPTATPKITKGRPPLRSERLEEMDAQERTALLSKVKKRQSYVKFGTRPTLYKQASFRAGPTLHRLSQQRKKRPPKYVKYGHGLLLYKNTPNMSPVVRSNLDAQTERAVHALEEALESKDLNDPVVSSSTL